MDGVVCGRRIVWGDILTYYLKRGHDRANN